MWVWMYNDSLYLALVTVWRRSRVTGSGCVWSGPIKTAHCWLAALMTRRCACGWWPPRSARRSCGSTSMWWSASPGPLRAHTLPYLRLQALRYIVFLDGRLLAFLLPLFPFSASWNTYCILLLICHVNSLLAEQEEWKAWAIPVIWIQRQDH